MTDRTAVERIATNRHRRTGGAPVLFIIGLVLLVVVVLALQVRYDFVTRLARRFSDETKVAQDQPIDLPTITKKIDIARKDIAEVGRARQAADAVYEKELHDIAADALPFGVLTPFLPVEAAAMIATTIETRAVDVRAKRAQAMREFDERADQCNARFSELWDKRKELLAAEGRH